MSSQSQNALHSQPHLLESRCHDNDDETKLIRRTDSCGSLDSHSHIYRQMKGGGGGGEVRRNSEATVIRQPNTSDMQRGVGGAGRVTSPLAGTDYVFKPIQERRPLTANHLSVDKGDWSGKRIRSPQHAIIHSSTSIDSAPPTGRVSLHQSPPPPATITRHQSMETQRLHSVSPNPHSSLATRPRDVINSKYRRGSGPEVFTTRGGVAMNHHRSAGNVRCESLV